MSVEPFEELSDERTSPGAKVNVGAYMVVVLLHTLPPLQISNLKKYFSVEEAKAAAKEEGTPLERAKVEGRTQGALTVTP